MFGWFKRTRITNDQILAQVSALDARVASFEQKLTRLQQTLDALLKKYKCIICGKEFARLPHESDKRCPACQSQIKAISSPSLSNGNSGHRGAGHNTRGIHKKAGV